MMSILMGILTVVLIILIVAILSALIGGLLMAIISVINWSCSKRYFKSRKAKKYVRDILRATKRGEIAWEACYIHRVDFDGKWGDLRLSLTSISSFIRLSVSGESIAQADFPWRGDLKVLRSLVKDRLAKVAEKKMDKRMEGVYEKIQERR